jgi:thymidylate kinase
MPYIISLMGSDGSGKSTLARVLASRLQARDQPAVVVWATLRPVLMRPFIKAAKFLLVRKHDKFADYDGHMEVKRAGMRKLRWTHGIYFLLMLVDYLPQVLYKVSWQKLRGRNVICDRYFYDLILDYGAHVNAPVERVLQLAQRVSFLFPRPDLNYLVAVPPEVALNRKTDIPSRSYLEERAHLYEVLGHQFGGKVLDGTLELERNCAAIMDDMDKLEV